MHTSTRVGGCSNRRHAGWQYANAFDYNPITTPPYCDNVDQTVDDGCLLLSDDFLQYWLGAQLFIEDGGTDAETGEPVPLAGTALGAFDGLDWTLNGGDSADNHHPNIAWNDSVVPDDVEPAKADVFPQFSSDSFASWQTGRGRRVQPAYRQLLPLLRPKRHQSYKRLMTRTIDLTGVDAAELSFFDVVDTEPDWDYLFVEAHTVGQDDWTTLPAVDPARHRPWTPANRARRAGTPIPTMRSTRSSPTTRPGTAPTWHVIPSARPGSGTPRPAPLAGRTGRSTCRATPAAGRGIDLVRKRLGHAGHRRVPRRHHGVDRGAAPSRSRPASAHGPSPGPPGQPINGNDWTRTTDVGYEEGAVVTMAPTNADFRTLYFGFGFEGGRRRKERTELMGRAIDYLLVP